MNQDIKEKKLPEKINREYITPRRAIGSGHVESDIELAIDLLSQTVNDLIDYLSEKEKENG